MGKIFTLIAVIAFTGTFFSAHDSDAASAANLLFDKLSYVGQGYISSATSSNRLIIEGEVGGATKVLLVNLESSSSDEKDYIDFCRKAALLTLSNNAKYRFEAAAYGDVDSYSVEIDLATPGHTLYCNLDLKN